MVAVCTLFKGRVIVLALGTGGAASCGDYGPEANPPTGPSNTACGEACTCCCPLVPSEPFAPLCPGLPEPTGSPLRTARPFSEPVESPSDLLYDVSFVPSGWSRPLDKYLDLCASRCPEATPAGSSTPLAPPSCQVPFAGLS